MTDFTYEAERNALIPQAEKEASAICGAAPQYGTPGYQDWALRWDVAFLKAMDRLWRERK